MDDLEDEALDNPIFALRYRELDLDGRYRQMCVEEQGNILQPSALLQNLTQLSTNNRLELLPVSWRIAHSQRRRARNLQRKLDDTNKELDRQKRQSRHCIELVMETVRKRITKTLAHKARQQGGSSPRGCLICQTTETDAVTDCGHAFCTECICHWKDLGQLCPICRQPFDGPYPLHI